MNRIVRMAVTATAFTALVACDPIGGSDDTGKSTNQSASASPTGTSTRGAKKSPTLTATPSPTRSYRSTGETIDLFGLRIPLMEGWVWDGPDAVDIGSIKMDAFRDESSCENQDGGRFCVTYLVYSYTNDSDRMKWRGCSDSPTRVDRVVKTGGVPTDLYVGEDVCESVGVQQYIWEIRSKRVAVVAVGGGSLHVELDKVNYALAHAEWVN